MSIVVTVFDPPPIAVRGYDWHAYIEGDKEGPTGYGETEIEAVIKLAEKLANIVDIQSS